MTNTICCGGITREDEASETFPERAPERTKNCYKEFNYDDCNANCCGKHGSARPDQCKPDSFGGYCDDESSPRGYKYFNGSLINITPAMLRDQQSRSDELYAERDQRLRRRMRRMDQRDTINLLRQSEIMTEDRSHGAQSPSPAAPPPDSISNFFYDLGIGFSTIIILMSVFVILVHNGIIKFHK